MHCYSAVNARDILMRNSRLLARQTVPQLHENPTTRKHKLHNDFISFLSERSLTWRGDEVLNVGVAFVRAMVDALWAIDGHQCVCIEKYKVVTCDHFPCFTITPSCPIIFIIRLVSTVGDNYNLLMSVQFEYSSGRMQCLKKKLTTGRYSNPQQVHHVEGKGEERFKKGGPAHSCRLGYSGTSNNGPSRRQAALRQRTM